MMTNSKTPMIDMVLDIATQARGAHLIRAGVEDLAAEIQTVLAQRDALQSANNTTLHQPRNEQQQLADDDYAMLAVLAAQRTAESWESPLTGSTPLYRHPATEADALALLVAAGWKSIEHAHDVYGLGWNVTMRSNPRRVLIAPLGAAYE